MDWWLGCLEHQYVNKKGIKTKEKELEQPLWGKRQEKNEGDLFAKKENKKNIVWEYAHVFVNVLLCADLRKSANTLYKLKCWTFCQSELNQDFLDHS